MEVILVLSAVFISTSLAETLSPEAEQAYNVWVEKMKQQNRYSWIQSVVGNDPPNKIRHNFYNNYLKVVNSIDDYLHNRRSFWLRLNEWAAFSDDELRNLDPFNTAAEISDDISPITSMSEDQMRYVEENRAFNSSYDLLKPTPFFLGNTVVRRNVDWRKRNAICKPLHPVHHLCNASYAYAVATTICGNLQAVTTLCGISITGQQFIDCSFKDNVEFKGYTPCQNSKFGFNGPGDAVIRAYKFAILNGLTAADEYNYYDAGATQAQTCRRKGHGSSHYHISGYVILPRGPEAQIALMVAINHYGPVTVSIGFRFEPEFMRYGGGIYDLPCYKGKTLTMVVVGYGEENGKQYWLVQNNWGTEWGQFGMIKIARNTVTGCDLTHQAVFAHVGEFAQPADHYEDWNLWPEKEANFTQMLRAKYPNQLELDLPNWPDIFGTAASFEHILPGK